VSVISGDSWDTPLIPLLCSEVVKDEKGRAAVLDRLLDLRVTAVLKTWFARLDSERPEERWTVERKRPRIGAACTHPSETDRSA
jgi:hypothetical protein